MQRFVCFSREKDEVNIFSMNILIVNYEYPPIGAGAGIQSQILAEELSKRHRVMVLTSSFRGVPSEELKNENLIIRRVPTLRRYEYRALPIELILFFFMGLVASWRMIRKDKIDVTIAFFTTPCGYIASALKKIFKIPYLVSLRGFDVPGFFSEDFGLLQTLNLPLIKATWRYADGVIANSNALADLAAKTAHGLNIAVIPNAVEKETLLRNRPSNKKDKEDGIVRILTVGRLTKQKGIEYLIEGLSLLGKDEKYRLDIVGDGTLKMALAEKADHYGMRQNVIFHGWIDRNKLSDLYQKADIFVLLSLDEGMSNVLLEALSSALPIIATDISANRPLISDGVNGFLVPVKDKVAVAEKLSRLMKNPELRNRFSEESIKIAKDFLPEKMAASYENACQRILERKNFK